MASSTLPLRSMATEQVGRKRRRTVADNNKDQSSHAQSRRFRRRLENISCGVCSRMLSHDGLESLNSIEGFQHRSRTGCTSSATAGCGMCKLFLTIICKEHGNNWAPEECLIFRNLDVSCSSLYAPNSHPVGIYGLQGALESSPTECIITIRIFAKESDPIAEIVHQRPLRRDVQSDKVFEAAKALIEECMHPDHPHQHCQYSRDTVLPLRVLDVGEPGSPHPTLRLVVNDTDTHAQYVALSYCWGKQLDTTTKPLQLRRDSLEELMGGIKLENLQQSIQDAIFATRKLGFRYLWIDALCIIQDCAIDKSTEISRMASIYKNASVTIAASTSENAAHGFLAQNLQIYCPDYQIDIPIAENTMGTVYLSVEPYEPDHPLDKRGWTLQEFMLSSRMLIFSDYELLWQCKEMDLRSVSRRGLEYLQPLESLPWTVFENDTEPYYGNLDYDKLYLWKTIVQQYTDRKLTDPTDKLKAIMGITSELETLWHDTNIYGLWKKWFIQLLAWYKPDVEREEKRNLERAPSWSWASLDGVIRYENISTEDATVKSLTVQSAILNCRVLRASDIAARKAKTILEGPDLIHPVAELQKLGYGLERMKYLLLGITMKIHTGVEQGVGLLVFDVGGGLYRRIGLAIFKEMSIWRDISLKNITLEARIDK
ncbi:heterokaryon incompatibility domain-containing protein [Trichoderma chlorosporum]